MTQEEYNRLREYEKIDNDIRALNDAILITEDLQVVCWDNETKHNIVMHAIYLCKDKLADMFRDKLQELLRERDNI